MATDRFEAEEEIGLNVMQGKSTQRRYFATGALSGSSYGDIGFAWGRAMWPSVLLSYERGLITYYPVFGLVLIAGLAIRSLRMATLLWATCCFAYALLYGFWPSWYLGEGFGHRGFVELVPWTVLLLGLALQRQPIRVRRPIIVVGSSVDVGLLDRNTSLLGYGP